MISPFRSLLVVVCLIGGMGSSALAQPDRVQPVHESSPGEEDEGMFSSVPKINLLAPTLGGRQFWGDVLFFRGYRIQHHVLSDHYRLLSPADFRLAWGTEEECRAALEEVKREQALLPMSGRAVILLHGIIRSSKSFSSLKKNLEKSGRLVVGFDYPSTRVSMTDAAQYLQKVIESLEGVEQIDLVCHSMGGLVVRTYLQQTGIHRDPRLRRMVMLGVPNTGATMANLLKENKIFQWTLGPAGQQLIEGDSEFIASLPVPDFEFAIIAGARGTEQGWNPLVPGDDDGTISVDSTKLPGAADFMTVEALHSSMMWDKVVIQATERFLETGVLRDSGKREPIPVPVVLYD
ncbi:MAG TPA: alpha/beta fold hydrolase [Planctomicrobium sp.]|nr:alpha/beta fold hydrolase [Planctomicrobium sp.]